MADLPLSFYPPMVRALLREIEAPGTGKTQTRRVVDPFPYDPTLRPGMAGYKPAPLRLWQVAHGGPYFLPRYSVGDRLYVREHWRTTSMWDAFAPRELGTIAPVRYEADGQVNEPKYWSTLSVPVEYGRFRQGMHMPRWASRITLLVTEVRVERLQDCSEADAVAEGVLAPGVCDLLDLCGGRGAGLCGCQAIRPRDLYAALWDQINGPGAWALNPWVAAYTFRPILGNIDRIQTEPKR